MRTHRFQDKQYCIELVQKYLHDHIDETLARDLLAEVAGLRVPHFQPIPMAMLCRDTFTGQARRVRNDPTLEEGINRVKLHMTSAPINDCDKATDFCMSCTGR
jgi:hypothetical protein